MDKTFSRRIRKVRAFLRARHIGAMLFTSPENRRYLSGFTAEDASIAESSGALLVMAGEAILLTDGRYETQARSDCQDFRIFIYRKGLHEALRYIAAEAGIKKMAYEPGYITCSGLDAIKAVCPQVEPVPLAGKIEAMRSIKSEAELELIKKAIRAAEDVFEAVLTGLRPGMTEKEVAWRIIEGLSMEADGPSFSPIVASGPNAALPHAVPGDRKIAEGEPVIIDMGARLNGYSSDMTRTVFIGPPASPFKEVYKTVRMAQLAAQDVIRAGLTGRFVDAVARGIIKDAGFGSFFNHSLGHGVGLAVHEAPILSPRAKKVLRPGMVVTIEPGVYMPDKGGIRLENMVYVGKSGGILLSRQDWFYDF
ncbi:MAG: Xaa-Pro peptidase family protein [Desulfobacteraceae bacterium]|nr:Xaa-Pro peptidase family protein [Desulfobacteraceae bacterium]